MPDEDDRLDNDACGDLDDVFAQQHSTNNCEPVDQPLFETSNATTLTTRLSR